MAETAHRVPPATGVDFAALPRVAERSDVVPSALAGSGVLDGEQPLVLRGLVRDWPETGLAARDLLDIISASASERPLPFYTASPDAGGRVFYDDTLRGFNFERRKGRLADCCHWLRENADRPDAGMLYVGSTAVDGWWPGFADSHPMDLGVEQPLCSLWLGTRARIAAHYDFPRNLACVVAGRRRFTLFPPEQVLNLYPGPLEHTPSGQPISLVDFHAIDEQRFPRFRDALDAALVAELEPGDALYMPGMWWHHVEALDPVNLLVNYWWRDSPLHLGSPQAALLHAALTLGQLSAQEREPWRALFEHCVFAREPDKWSHINAASRGVLGPVDESQAHRLRQQIARQLQP